MLVHGLVFLEHLLHLNVDCAMLAHGPLSFQLHLNPHAQIALQGRIQTLLQQLSVFPALQDHGVAL
jgi:hypothetical protein